MGILNDILSRKNEGLKYRKTLLPIQDLKARIKDLPPSRPFKASISRKPEMKEPIRLIAEIKKASPSRGIIRQDFDPLKIASIYEEKGANAISVLTEEHFFKGTLKYLEEIRKVTQRPLLRKDFIIEDYQVYESRAYCADAILLIVAALNKYQLIDLMGLSTELSLDCLVEVHDFKELDTALYSGAEIIGINNRDLKTMEIDINTTTKLIKEIPKEKTVVSESGVKTRQDVTKLEETGVDAILVGTALMESGDIGLKIDELLGRRIRSSH